jgi:hypothetical protein
MVVPKSRFVTFQSKDMSMSNVVSSVPKYRVITKIPYFNHTREFFTFDEMQAWIHSAVGIVFETPMDALGQHTRIHGQGEFTVSEIHR